MTKKENKKNKYYSTRGFTLAEVAIALTVVSLVIGAVVPTMLSLRASQQLAATQQKVETVMRAVASFTIGNGCLPCPTPASEVNAQGLGKVRGDRSASPAACGVCSNQVGLVPFASLGLTEAHAKDGHGRWLTYAVDSTLTASFGIVPPSTPCRTAGGTCTADEAASNLRAQGLCQENLSKTNSLKVWLSNGNETNYAVLVMSHGANGRGVYRNYPETATDRFSFPDSAMACSAGAGQERCNADDNTSFSDGLSSTAGDNPFDDVLLYLGRNALLSYLGNPSCDTAW